MHKALSAAEACRALNSSIQVETHLEALTPANAGKCRAAAVWLCQRWGTRLHCPVSGAAAVLPHATPAACSGCATPWQHPCPAMTCTHP